MLGTIVNVIAIIVGSIIGLIFKGGISKKINETVMKGLALCVLYIGISSAQKGDDFLLVITSIVIGAVIGEWIDIDEKLNKLGEILENIFKRFGGKIAEGFVTTSLLYCVGAMAIVGSLESGLQNNHETLFAKSILDGVSAVIFASSLGFGVTLSAISVFLYQGGLTLCAGFLKYVLTTSVINNMTSIGGLLIIGLGLNLLETTKIKIVNLLPAAFIPVVYQLILTFIK